MTFFSRRFASVLVLFLLSVSCCDLAGSSGALDFPGLVASASGGNSARQFAAAQAQRSPSENRLGLEIEVGSFKDGQIDFAKAAEFDEARGERLALPNATAVRATVLESETPPVSFDPSGKPVGSATPETPEEKSQADGAGIETANPPGTSSESAAQEAPLSAPSPAAETASSDQPRAELPGSLPAQPAPNEPAQSKADSQDGKTVSEDRQSTSHTQGPSDTFLLRYKFQPGEVVRWEVLQQARVKTTVGGTSQTAESVTQSVKAWRVISVSKDGKITFEPLVESVQMWQKLTGRDEQRYDSRTDTDPAPPFQAIAQTVNVPLGTFTIDAQGQVLKRVRNPIAAPQNSDILMTILLPEQPVAIGATWSFPYEIELPLENGTIKVVKAAQLYKLVDVKTGVAIIETTTKVLTPINDPGLEAKLVQREKHGTVRFDIQEGRILRQENLTDRRVVGFSGPASSLHFACQVTESLLPPTDRTARASQQSAQPVAEKR